MKSNEEYLDELLRAMESDDDLVMHSTDIDDPVIHSTDIDDASVDDNAIDILTEEVEMTGEPEMDGDDLSASSLEQLMAEIQESSQDFEELDFESDDIMSEESIDDLLNTAKENGRQAEDAVPIEEDDFLSMDLDDHEEVSDIKKLLDMADNNEIIDDSEIPVGEEQILSMEDLDSLLEDRSEGDEAEAPKEKKWIKADQSSDGEAKSGFGKFLSLLFEEEPEDMEPEEAGNMKLSEENRDILSQIDKENKSKKKAKPKKEKNKKKKGEAEEGEEKDTKKKAKKAPKLKKGKKPKKEKPIKEEVHEKPEKLLPKKKVVVTSIFAASILIAILLLEFFLPPLYTLTIAREAYSRQEYDTAYHDFYGEKLNEGDEERFQTSRAVMRMQTNLDSYNSFLKMGDEVKALHFLIEGVHVKDDVYVLAENYGAAAEVDAVYTEILAILSSNYGLAEEDARALINEKSDLVYTKKLQAIVGGTEYTESTVVPTEISQEDMLPEEEEIVQMVTQ